ncbi:ParA family protein [Orrella sp. NBD-18]|uniref:ParA family protein n=1 Tax=Sheuella amnicola TaxID=2707330 RepID=A0A6B2R7R9_9BURK|nr:ParA family protein [Sheuella amnicola]NDY83335.1 ParA family protein [Sheuella amnicola]
MTITIAIANQKGGCAKTTTAVNLSAGLVASGKNVLLIDLDPQANTSQWIGANNHVGGVFELLTEKSDVQALVQTTGIEGLSIIRGARELSNLEKALAGELAVESRLKRRLKSMDLNQYDYVIIDTPPTLSLITLNALSAADSVLIPVTTHVMTLSGVAQLIQTLEEVREVLNPQLKILGLLPCRVDLRTRHSQDILDALTERFGDQVLKSHIHENVRIAEAPSFKQSIFDYRPKSSAAEDFRMLAQEVINLAH